MAKKLMMMVVVVIMHMVVRYCGIVGTGYMEELAFKTHRVGNCGSRSIARLRNTVRKSMEGRQCMEARRPF